MMRLLVAIIVIVAAFYFGPQILESASDPCGALANRALAADGAGAFGRLGSLIGGAAVRATVEKRYPNTPPGVVCAGDYWLYLVNPPARQQAQQQ